MRKCQFNIDADIKCHSVLVWEKVFYAFSPKGNVIFEVEKDITVEETAPFNKYNEIQKKFQCLQNRSGWMFAMF